MENVYWMLVGEILLFFIAYQVSGKDILAPSVISIFMFIIATIGIIYNKEYWDVSYGINTAIIVLLTQLSMVIAEIIVVKNSKKSKKYIKEKQPISLDKTEINIPIKINFFIVSVLLVLALYYVYSIFKSGSMLGASGLSVIGATKYSEEGIDIFSKLAFRIINLFYFIYIYILVNNKVVSGKKVRDNLINFIPVLCGFIIMLFSGSRKLLVQYPMALVLMYVIRKRDIYGRKSTSTKKIIKKVFPIVLLILISFYAMREISKSSTALANRTIVDYLTYYISSPLYLLDRYIQSPLNICSPSQYFGQYTFLGFYNTIISLGFLNFEVPSNNFQIVSNQANMAGNEFTWIQRPMEDFGTLGLLVITFLLFYIFNRIYFRKIVCGNNCQKRDICIILYAYFYFIVVLCFYCAYTITEISIQSFIYAMIIVALYKLLICRKNRKYIDLVRKDV